MREQRPGVSDGAWRGVILMVVVMGAAVGLLMLAGALG